MEALLVELEGKANFSSTVARPRCSAVPASASRSAAPSAAGGQARCLGAALAGGPAIDHGWRASPDDAETACSSLRCSRCDFQVLRRVGRSWRGRERGGPGAGDRQLAGGTGEGDDWDSDGSGDGRGAGATTTSTGGGEASYILIRTHYPSFDGALQACLRPDATAAAMMCQCSWGTARDAGAAAALSDRWACGGHDAG